MKLLQYILTAATVVTLPFIWWVTWKMVEASRFEEALWFAGITVMTWLGVVAVISLVTMDQESIEVESDST